MGKAPAFQFYVKDWLSDPKLRAASASTRGIWIDLLCYMFWENTGGCLELSKEELTKLTGSVNSDIDLFIKEAQEYKFCDLSVTRNASSQICHIKNRRMAREAKIRKSNAERQRRHRASRKNNAPVTSLPPSPSPIIRKTGFKKPYKNPQDDYRYYPDAEDVLRKKGMWPPKKRS